MSVILISHISLDSVGYHVSLRSFERLLHRNCGGWKVQCREREDFKGLRSHLKLPAAHASHCGQRRAVDFHIFPFKEY